MHLNAESFGSVLDPQTWCVFASALVENQRMRDAVGALGNALTLAAEDDRTRHRIIGLLAAINIPEAATLHTRIALELDADGQLELALEHAGIAGELRPLDPQCHRTYARIAARMNRTEEAIDAWSRVLWIDPKDYASALELAALLASAGRPRSAIMIVKQIGDRLPDAPEHLLALGRVYLRSGFAQDALPLLQRAVAIEPDRAEAHCELGSALASLGMTNDAVGAFKTAASLRPGWEEPTHRWGVLLAEVGQIESARSLLEMALTAAPWSRAIREDLERINVIAAADDDTAPIPMSNHGFDFNLAAFGLSDVIEFLYMHRQTGMLTVRDDDHEVGFEFFEGRIAGVRCPSCDLAQALEDEQLIVRGVFEDAEIRPMQMRPSEVLDAVVGLGIDRERLSDVAFRQIQIALGRALSNERGTATFGSLSLMQRTSPELSFDTRWALMEAVKRLDESQK